MPSAPEHLRRRAFALPRRGPGALAAIEMGPPRRPIDVIFLHANGFNGLTYRHILAPLADELHLLVIDQRGHGASTLSARPEDRRDWLDLRDDLIALLALLDLDHVVLGGHSMGGTVSLLAAAELRHASLRLALFDPVILRQPLQAGGEGDRVATPLARAALRRRSVFPDRREARGAYAGRGAFKTWPDEVLDDYLEDGLRLRSDGEFELSCAPAWEASNFISQGHDTWGAIASSNAPIRILRAELGSTCTLDRRIDPHVASGRITVETIAGASHFLPMERPELVQAEIRAATQRG